MDFRGGEGKFRYDLSGVNHKAGMPRSRMMRMLCCGLKRRSCVFITVICMFCSVTTYIFLMGFIYHQNGPFHSKQNNGDIFYTDTYEKILLSKFVRRGREWRISDDPDESQGGPCMTSSFEAAGNRSNSSSCLMDCKDLKNLSKIQYIASGWTKSTYKVTIHGKKYAVKVVNLHGHEMQTCLKASVPDTEYCYRKAASKILNEILYLKKLDHQNVIKLLGYCIPYENPGIRENSVVMLVTEVGEPLDIIRLLQMMWEDRLHVALDLSHLLYHLSHSPVGPVAIRDFRRQQFVLVDGVFKLSDVDDLDFSNPNCRFPKDCILQIPNNTFGISVPCHNGQCLRYNEKLNIIHASRYFMNFLISHGAPSALQKAVDEIVQAYRNASWSALQLKKAIVHLVKTFSEGTYRNKTTHYLKKFLLLKDSDLPMQFDYRCHLRAAGTMGCVLSVFDEEEAAEICLSDSNCKTFVITNHKTWTGRRIVHFKNGFGIPEKNQGAMLYVKM